VTGLVVALVVLVALVPTLWRLWSRVSGDEAKRLVHQGAALIDVQQRGGFQKRHLTKARNIPLAELARRADEVGNRQRPVVVYGDAGSGSAAAVRILRNAGFRQVFDLGTMARWS
jgi:phage shock protein E